MTTHEEPGRYDVVVVGQHLTTALLAAILARHGAGVAVVPSAADGTIPAGETTVPYTAELFFLLGRRFEIPEISRMGMFHDLPESLRKTSGVKRNLGFLYHREGTPHDPGEALQFAVPSEHAEWHLYRPDVDEYAAMVAERYGATVHAAPAEAGGVRVDADGVSVALADGRVIHAEYLVDGSGDETLRAEAPRAEALPALETGGTTHRVRLLYTHLTGVRPFESIIPMARYQKAKPWEGGTLLHAFDGGWVQVAPFGNHEEGVNSRCSVTASLDPERYPADGSSPEADFGHVVNRFPELRLQFAGSRNVRPWLRDENLPARVSWCAGPRWFLFDRSATRHDLLLSRDLTMSLEVLHATAAGLLRVVRQRDWTGTGMETASRFQLQLFECHDRFIAAGRTASSGFLLWNAYLRTWLLWSILSALSVKRARMDGEAAAGPGRWSTVERFGQAEYWYQVPSGLPQLMDASLSDFEAVRRGGNPKAACDRIYHRLRREPFVPPLFKFGDPRAKYYEFSRGRRLRMLLWTKTAAPPDFRRLLTADNVTAAPASH